MSGIVELFSSIAQQYGIVTAIIILLIIGILWAVYKIINNSSATITKYLEYKLGEPVEEHKKAVVHRKNITPEVRTLLSDLAKECKADRVLLLEYSNGNSNLVGLPFLYVTATCEVVTPGTESVSPQFQRLNTALFAEFLEDLESKGLLFYEDIANLREDSPMLHCLMEQEDVTSALFYSLSGMDSTIGLIIVASVDGKKLTRKDTIPKTTAVAQRITSLLNYNEISDSRI